MSNYPKIMLVWDDEFESRKEEMLVLCEVEDGYIVADTEIYPTLPTINKPAQEHKLYHFKRAEDIPEKEEAYEIIARWPGMGLNCYIGEKLLKDSNHSFRSETGISFHKNDLENMPHLFKKTYIISNLTKDESNK